LGDPQRLIARLYVDADVRAHADIPALGIVVHQHRRPLDTDPLLRGDVLHFAVMPTPQDGLLDQDPHGLGLLEVDGFRTDFHGFARGFQHQVRGSGDAELVRPQLHRRAVTVRETHGAGTAVEHYLLAARTAEGVTGVPGSG